MKTNVVIIMIIAVSMILCPVAAVGVNPDPKTKPAQTQIETEETADGAEYISVMSS